MNEIGFVCWRTEGWWVGYLRGYPAYWTQGETLEDLKEHLQDLYLEVKRGALPIIREPF